MRPLYLSGLFGIFILTGLLRADDFSNFRVPPHRLQNITGSASGVFFDDRYRDWRYYPASVSFSRELIRLNGEVAGRGAWLYDSDPFRSDIQLEGTLSGSHEDDDQISGDRPVRTTMSGSTSGSDASAALFGDFRYYPGSRPIGIFTAGSLTASADGWYSDGVYERGMVVQRYRTNQTDVKFEMSLDFGVGFGRVRDVTAVYDVQVLEERLQREGILTGSLSADTRRKLMDLFYVRGYYNTIHDRADKFLWRDVESILRTDSALHAPPGAYALFRMAEGYLQPAYADTESGRYFAGEELSRFNLNRSRLFRQRGFFIGPVVEVRHTRDYYASSHHSRADTTYPGQMPFGSDNYWADDDQYNLWDVVIGPRVEVHIPYGWRWQFDVTGTVVFPEHGEEVHDLAELRAANLITDRVRADFLLRYDGNSHNSTDDAQWRTIASLGVQYYIEDHVSLSAALTQLQGKRMQLGTEPGPVYYYSNQFTPLLYPYAPKFQRVYQTTIGLNYHFRGVLDTFGLVPPVTLLRQVD